MADSLRSRVVVVEGPPGAGRTRLLAEALELATRNGFAVAGGLPPGAGAPPHPGGGAPRPPAGVSPPRAGGPAPGTGAAPPGAGSPARGAPPIRGGVRARPPGAPGGAVLAPPGQSAVEAVAVRLRGRAEAAPAQVVALDDLHLADHAALTTLCELIADPGARPVLWLLSFASTGDAVAPHPVPACLGRLRRGLGADRLPELGPLSGDPLAQLVADWAGAPPDAALLALVESVEATPRAVIDLVRGLVEDGEVCVLDGAARLGPPDQGARGPGGGVHLPAPVPRRLSALVQRELRSLSEPTMKALRLAAVLGSPFAPEDLSAMLGEAPVGLLAAVDEAVGRGLLVCGEHDLAFRTEPIWRVLLDSVPPPVCALLRRQAAELLLPRPDGVERAALQLVHVAQPGSTQELRAIAEGSRRLLASDPSTAAALATHCMELLPPGRAEHLRCARTAVEALTRAGDLDRAIALAQETIDEAVRFAAPSPDALAEDLAALRASMSTALLLLGNAQSARRAAGDALAVREGGPPHREAVVTHLAASYLTGDDSAAEQTLRILSAPDDHPRDVRVGAMAFQAFGQWQDGRVGHAVGTLRRAVALDRAEEGAHAVDPRWFLAFALTRIDEYEEAAAVVRSAARSAPTEAGTLAATVPAVLRAPLHLAQGHLDEAEEAARAGAGGAGPCVPMLAPQAWLVLAFAALRRGRWRRPRSTSGPWRRTSPSTPPAPGGPHGCCSARSWPRRRRSPRRRRRSWRRWRAARARCANSCWRTRPPRPGRCAARSRPDDRSWRGRWSRRPSCCARGTRRCGRCSPRRCTRGRWPPGTRGAWPGRAGCTATRGHGPRPRRTMRGCCWRAARRSTRSVNWTGRWRPSAHSAATGTRPGCGPGCGSSGCAAGTGRTPSARSPGGRA
ncbi:LuxR family transcriptional regulator [Streptomyces sanyensis]|uniref:LuxR family transcriptional regulator n=1 Tax=Streptomyces sanyensis TaxID=568869 RepID=UPI003D77AA32